MIKLFFRLLNLLPIELIVTGFGIGKLSTISREIFITIVSVLLCILAVEYFSYLETEGKKYIGIIGAPIMTMSLFLIPIGMILIAIYTKRRTYTIGDVIIHKIAGQCFLIALCAPVINELYTFFLGLFGQMCEDFFNCWAWIPYALSFIVVSPIPTYLFFYCREAVLWPLTVTERFLPPSINMMLSGTITAFYVGLVIYIVFIIPLKMKISFLIDYFIYTFKYSTYIFFDIIGQAVPKEIPLPESLK